jgi:acyl-CoA reductase-like NAD-dependent aldehyde dehydrogenase
VAPGTRCALEHGGAAPVIVDKSADLDAIIGRPAILVDPPRDAKVSTHEIFGITAANSLPVAFQASIFTRDLDVAFDTAARLDALAVMVNDHSAFRTDWMPFAGRRESGYGIGGIPYTMAEMTAGKMIVFKRR